MKDEHNYQKILQALNDMQQQIEEQVRPIAEQVVRSEVDRLREQSEQYMQGLAACVNNIDKSILKCHSHVNEYHQARADLEAVNERLASLGVEPVSTPQVLPAENLYDVLMARLTELRAEGKI
jgi:hypothetical protein